MGTQTTGGGSLTSFNNTPQANPDYYTLREDEILASPGLYNYNTTSKTFTFDVMSNDLGGNAKSLFSVEDDWGNPIAGDTTLLDKDTLDTAGASQWELTASGNWIRIVNGKIEYRIADTAHPFDPNMARDVNSLGVADSVVNDTFVYAIRLGNGTLSKATVTVNILGANDGPAANADASGTGENSALTVNVVGNDTDPDSADTLTVTSASAPPGKGIASVVGNQVRFDPGAAFDHLAQGATENVVVTYSISDGHGGSSTSTLTITVTGTNDGPTANADTAGGGENQVLTINVLANDTDPDDGTVLTVTAASAPSGKGTASVVGNQVQFNPGTDFDHLAQGVTENVVVNYTIQDQFGATSNSTVTITVTGTNDTPVAHADTAAGTENQTLLVDVLANDTDADDGHVLTLTGVSAPSGKGTASVVGNQVQFNPGADFDHLAQGATENVVVTYTIQDQFGATSNSSVTITVTGTNDTPVANADTAAGTENQTLLVNVLANDTDADDGAVLTVTAASAPSGKGTASVVGNQVQFNPGTDFDHLAQGVTENVVVNYTMQDEHGATSTSSVTITVTGTNDTPVAQAASNSLDEDTSVSGNIGATDADDGATLTYALTGAAPAGLTFHTDGSYTFDAASYDSLAEGEPLVLTIPFTATDQLNATSAPANLTITITGTNDAPVVNNVSVTTPAEDGPAVGGSFSGDDVDSDDSPSTLTYTITSGPGEGSVVNNNDGTFSFDPGGDFQDLAEGETRQVSFTYTATDAHDAVSNTGTVTLTVTGTNDDPVIAIADGDSAAETLDETDAALTTSGTLTVTDADTSNVVGTEVSSVTLGGTTGGLIPSDVLGMLGLEGDVDLQANTGDVNNLDWTFNSGSQAFDFLADGEELTLTYTLTSTDDEGATDTQDVTITIRGSNDGVVITSGEQSEEISEDGTSVGGSISFTDADLSDGHTASAAANPANGTALGAFVVDSSATEAVNASNGSVGWTYTVDNEAAEYLAFGESAVEKYDVTIDDGHGGEIIETVTVTVTGENDGPDIRAETGDSIGADRDEGNSGLTASGTLTVTDPDTSDTISTTATLAFSGNTGTLSADDLLAMFDLTDGTGADLAADSGDLHNLHWSFDSGSEAFDFLAEGQELTLTYTLTSDDGNGGTDAQEVTITITGTNDEPVLAASVTAGTYTDTSDDDSFSSITGTLSTVDPDSGDHAAYSVSDGVADDSRPGYDFSSSSSYGTLYLNSSTGAYEFVPNDTAIEALKGDDQVAFTLTVTDDAGASDSETLTIDIDGTNDTPVLSATLTEATFTDTSGNDSFSAVSGDLSSTDRDSPETATYGTLNGVPDDSLDGYDTSETTTYGKLYVDSATGNYTFVPDDAGIEGLTAGTTLFFTLQVTDGSNGTVGQTLTINLVGANDIPEAPDTGSVTTNEDTASAATAIGASDRDLGETLTYSVKAGTEPDKGSVSFDQANGTFTYTPDANANGSDSFTILVTDHDGETTEQVVSVTITAVNDNPVAGDDTASTDEDTPLNLSAATLLANDTDVDIATNSQVLSISDVENGTHGSAVVNPDGSVTYTPDPNFYGTDTITYTVSDGNGGTDTATVTITVNAVNDAPEAGTDAYTTPEDTPLVVGAASGVLGNDSDVEGDSLSVVAGTVATANGGSVTFAADGSFSYTPAANFNGTDSVSYTVSDGNGGFGNGTVLLTVTPVNDAAEITGDATGSVTESGGVGESDPGIPTAAGDLDSTDVDNAADSWTVVSTPTSSYYGYGTFTIDATGHWTYTVDNTDPIVNGLNGTSITDQFTVTTVDGTEQVVEVTINGTNDAAYITGEAQGQVYEAGEASAGFPTASGDLRSDDVDNADDEFQVVDTPTASDKGYGTYTVGNLGTWTYELDNGNDDVQALNVGDTATDTFTVYSEDGTPQVVTVTIHGANDAATIGGEDFGEVVEATPSNLGTPTASGTLTADDVDNVDNHFQANSGTSVNGYGTFSVDADGNWSYTLDNTNPDVAALNNSDTLGDTFEVLSDDGTSHFVTIKIDGATDNVAPTLAADTLYVSNSTVATFSTDVLLANDTDPDGLSLTITNVSGPGVVLNTNGTFTVTTGSATTPFTFSYDATDGAGNTRTQSVLVNVVSTVDSGGGANNSINLTSVGAYQASFIDGKGGSDTLTDGSSGSIFIGGEGNDNLTGNAGEDVLIGGDGNDTLNGGAGNDILRGGLGNNDMMDGGAGTEDLLDFSDGTSALGAVANPFNLVQSGNVTPIANNTAGLGQNDRYQNMEGVIGTTFNDFISGSNSNDVLRGGAGNDTLDGRGGIDLLDFRDGTAGITFTLTQSSVGTVFNASAAGLGTDTYSNMEGVIGTAFDDTITGSTGNDTLRGEGGNDILSGLGGNDILTGGSGADNLTGGTGNDTFVFAPPLNNVDTITDYSNVAGNADIIDVTGILTVPTGADPAALGYLRVTTTGLVQVDTSGGGDSWMTIANVNTAGVGLYKFQYLQQNGTVATISVAPVAPPVALDLNGDGHVGFIGTDAGVTFDYGGGTVATAWVAPEDGILVRDANQDGAVTHNEMVFATTGSDLDGLSVYDSNHDGNLDAADSEFDEFAVWQDSNSNAVVDSGEMVNLTALGITSISLASDGLGYSTAGGDVQVVGTGSFTRADGTTGVLADSVFATGALSNQEQIRSALSAGSNVALVGAVAAAGLMAVPVQAEFRAESHSTLDPAAPAQAASLQSISPVQGTQESHALGGETQVPVDEPSVAAPHAAAPTDSPAEAHDIDAAPGLTAEALTSLLQGTELPDAASASQQLAGLDAIAPVSAEMLQSAMAGIAAHGGEPSVTAVNPGSDLSQVLADAIAGGSSHAPDIEALLSALPGADSGHPVATLAATAGADFTAESVALASLTQHMAFASEIMLIHQDAPPAAV